MKVPLLFYDMVLIVTSQKIEPTLSFLKILIFQEDSQDKTRSRAYFYEEEEEIYIRQSARNCWKSLHTCLPSSIWTTIRFSIQKSWPIAYVLWILLLVRTVLTKHCLVFFLFICNLSNYFPRLFRWHESYHSDIHLNIDRLTFVNIIIPYTITKLDNHNPFLCCIYDKISSLSMSLSLSFCNFEKENIYDKKTRYMK